jgi:hypothetical protein
MSDPRDRLPPAAPDAADETPVTVNGPSPNAQETETVENAPATGHGRYVQRMLKARTMRRLLLSTALLVSTAIAAAPTASGATATPPAQIAMLPPAGDSEICAQNIRVQEQQHRIPLGLLTAIGLTESGRTVSHGHRSVWPWTVNAAGDGHFFESKEDAVAFVAQQQAAGVDSIDVGCMQINLKHHPDAFASLEDAFDPATNVAYAADFLADLRTDIKSWMGAARRYHSATPELGQAYGEVVLANWTGPARQVELKRATAAGTPATADRAAIPGLPGGTLQMADAQSTTSTGFLRAMPVRVANAGFLRAAPAPVASADNLSLFSQIYNAPAVTQARATSALPGALRPAPAGSNVPAAVSFQKVFPRRVVPGQTGLTLRDYRVN